MQAFLFVPGLFCSATRGNQMDESGESTDSPGEPEVSGMRRPHQAGASLLLEAKRIAPSYYQSAEGMPGVQ